MASVINDSRKIVFSKTLDNVEEAPNWKNVRLLRDIRADEIMSLKEKQDMTIIGSGTIVQQFANLGLIDEYMFAIIPIVLGTGKPLFKNVKTTHLELLDSKAFGNGVVIMSYSPKSVRDPNSEAYGPATHRTVASST